MECSSRFNEIQWHDSQLVSFEIVLQVREAIHFISCNEYRIKAWAMTALWCQRILSPVTAVSPDLTKRYKPVFMRLAVVKVPL